MSNLHKNCLWGWLLIRRMFGAELNRAEYKNRVVGVRVMDQLDRKKYSEKSSFAHRVAWRYIELLQCLQTTFSASRICLFIIRGRSRYAGNHRLALKLLEQLSGNVMYHQSRSARQIRSVERRALYGARRDTRTRPEMASSRLRTSACPSFFFSLAILLCCRSARTSAFTIFMFPAPIMIYIITSLWPLQSLDFLAPTNWRNRNRISF